MDRFSGAYPAGPSRSGGLEQAEPNELRPIRGGEDHAREADLHDQKQRLRRRRVRLVVGIGATLLVSAGTGIFLGLRAARISEEAILFESESVNDTDEVISRELDRLIDELWKMEDLERLPRR